MEQCKHGGVRKWCPVCQSLAERKHSRCRGSVSHTMDGTDYDCEYNTDLSCEDCKYGLGRRDPEAKINKIK